MPCDSLVNLTEYVSVFEEIIATCIYVVRIVIIMLLSVVIAILDILVWSVHTLAVYSVPLQFITS